MSRASSFNTAVPAATLAEGLRALDLDLPETASAQLIAYLAELHKWNASYNLTAIRDPAEMATRHLLDSLTLLPFLAGSHLPSAASRVLDIGSGAGIPGLILAIARPDLQVVVLDSNGKKARFMRHAVRTLGLRNAEVIEDRAEDYTPAVPFDVILSRAFASLAEFVDCSRQALSANGRWLAMKGKVTDEERAALPPEMTIETIHSLTVPGLEEARSLVILRRSVVA
jgi:16S rRNA (guanine527-N7)-methyltransferase